MAAELKRAGLKPWLDDDEMYGDMNEAMADGIENAGAIVIFVTRQYMTKVRGRGPNGADDNCKFEFDCEHAARIRSLAVRCRRLRETHLTGV